ncbi:MAG: Rieske 2Fe-2S domain-containing protein [Mariniblastus sp.]|nr:Rieske 2Fe-2S domain-containing protein [Mariniblastus sp.]
MKPESTPETSPCDQCSGRRSFLAKLSIGLSGLIGAMMVLPGVAFVLGPVVRRKKEVWRAVGKLEQFDNEFKLVSYEDPSPVPWSGVTAQSGAWIRRVSDTEFIAFSITCRHLGCPVRWVKGPELFMCPCHGGVYYKDGTVAAGPPPEPLHRMQIRVVQGEVEIKTTPVPLTTTPLKASEV